MSIDKERLLESMVCAASSEDRVVRRTLIEACHEHLTNDLIERLSNDTSTWVRCTLKRYCYDRMTKEQKKRTVFGRED